MQPGSQSLDGVEPRRPEDEATQRIILAFDLHVQPTKGLAVVRLAERTQIPSRTGYGLYIAFNRLSGRFAIADTQWLTGRSIKHTIIGSHVQ